jgi:hypothetical protein
MDGFAPIFPGWNVWDVWQSEDSVGVLDAIMTLGLSLDRQLQIWTEDTIKDGAPGVAVADPLNPAALRGDQIQLIPSPNGLAILATRADLPELGGAVQLGEEGSKARKRTLRFYNRGTAALLPWAHDENYLLDVVYQPSASNPITNGEAPSSLGGVATEVVKGATKAGKVLLIGGGVVLVAVLLVSLSKKGR